MGTRWHSRQAERCRLALAALLTLLAALPAAAGALPPPTVELAARISPQTLGSSPGAFVPLGGRAVFAAAGAVWVTDGTTGGTEKLTAEPFASGYAPSFLTSCGGRIFFFGAFAQLWSTDGTAAGTAPVLADPSRLVGSHPPACFNGKLFFGGTDVAGGTELWKTDGTEAGTEQVRDINPGGTSSSPDGLQVVGNRVYFSADDGVSGRELWATDGMTAGTARVKDLVPGAGSDSIGRMAQAGGAAYFLAQGAPGPFTGGPCDLWKTDGTEPGTVVVRHFDGGCQITSIAGLGSQVVFDASDGAIGGAGRELWASDGTPGGTALVKDIQPLGGAEPGGFVPRGSLLVFRAAGQLWRTDGTAPGTQQIHAPGGGSLDPLGMFADGAEVVFGAGDGTTSQLWRTDGTDGGTHAVTSFTGAGYTGGGMRLGTGLLVAADDGLTGSELWRLDDAGGSPVLVKDIETRGTGSDPQDLTDVAGTLFFTADDHRGTGRQLWRLVAGGSPERITGPDAGLPAPWRIAAAGGHLFYSAFDAGHGYEVWVTDGTRDGTHLVRDINPGSGSSDPGVLTGIGSRLYFSAHDGGFTWSTWTTDGTEAGTTRVQAAPGNADPIAPSSFAAAGGLVYFTAGYTLWRTDGTAPGTIPLAPVCAPDDPDPAVTPLPWVTAFGDGVLFPSSAGGHGCELWRSSGTAASAALVDDAQPGPGSSDPHVRAVVNGRAYVSLRVAGVAGTGWYLWRTDGTPAGTQPFAGADGVTDVDGTAFFRQGYALWDVPPAASAPNQVRTLAFLPEPEPGAQASYAGAYFFAGDYDQLWESDGTDAGTFLVRDMMPGQHGGWLPHGLTASGGRLYFNGGDAQIGPELWSVTQARPPAPPASPAAGGSPSSSPPPSAVKGKASRLTVRLSARRMPRNRQRFVVTGALGLPAGVTAGAGCHGKVRVELRRSGRLLAGGTTTLSPACRYRTVLTRRSTARLPRSVQVRVRFLGNDLVLPLQPAARTVRVAG